MMQRNLIRTLGTLLLSCSIVYVLKWSSLLESKQNKFQIEPIYLVTVLTLWGSIEGLHHHQKLKHQRRQIASLDQKLAATSELYQQENQSLKTEQARKIQELATLQRRLRATKRLNHRIKKTQTRLIESNQTHIQQLQAQIDSLLFQQLALITLAQNRTECLRQKEAELQTLNQQYDQSIREGISYINQSETLQDNLDRITAENQALAVQTAQLQSEYTKKDRKLTALQAEYGILKRDRELLQTEYDKLARSKKRAINSFENEIIQALNQSRQCQKQDWVLEEAFIISAGGTSYLLDMIVFGRGFVAVIEAKYYPGLIRCEGSPENSNWFVYQKFGVTQGRQIRCAGLDNPYKQVMIYTQELNKALENRRNTYQNQVFTRAYGIALFPTQADLTEIRDALAPSAYYQVTTLDRLISSLHQLQIQTQEAHRNFSIPNSQILEAKRMRKLLMGYDTF
jgi:hypothetical protein